MSEPMDAATYEWNRANQAEAERDRLRAAAGYAVDHLTAAYELLTRPREELEAEGFFDQGAAGLHELVATARGYLTRALSNPTATTEAGVDMKECCEHLREATDSWPCCRYEDDHIATEPAGPDRVRDALRKVRGDPPTQPQGHA